MCDGTIIMGCTELDGTTPQRIDWDAQNGHIHDLIDETGTVVLDNRYHTHICYQTITQNDTDNNGYEEHEFTPESSYYLSTGIGVATNWQIRYDNYIKPYANQLLNLGAKEYRIPGYLQ